MEHCLLVMKFTLGRSTNHRLWFWSFWYIVSSLEPKKSSKLSKSSRQNLFIRSLLGTAELIMSPQYSLESRSRRFQFHWLLIEFRKHSSRRCDRRASASRSRNRQSRNFTVHGQWISEIIPRIVFKIQFHRCPQRVDCRVVGPRLYREIISGNYVERNSV